MVTTHRAALNGLPACGAARGNIVFSGVLAFINCPQCRDLETRKPQYMVKCDDCKQIVHYTENVMESYAGTICSVCKVK